MNSTAASSWRDKEYLSITDICQILSVSRGMAYSIARKLPSVKLGHRLLRIPTKNFIRYLEDRERAGA